MPHTSRMLNRSGHDLLKMATIHINDMSHLEVSRPARVIKKRKCSFSKPGSP